MATSMTPEQAVTLFNASEARAQKGIAAAIATKNFHLAAMNFRQSFKNHLMIALLKWRNEMDDPSGDLKSALAVTDLAIDALSGLNPESASALWMHFPMSVSAVVGFLATGSAGDRIERVLPTLATCDLGEGAGYEWLADSVLYLALTNRLSETDRATFLAIPVKADHALAKETYTGYLTMLSDATDADIAACERRFEERRTDPHYAGGLPFEGGGPDNKSIVDFRLAAVLKKVAHPTSSPHRWKWS